MSEEMAKARVERGARWLDSDESGAPKDWRAQIDLEQLTLWDPVRCVLGQLFTVRNEKGHVIEAGYNAAVDRRATTHSEGGVNRFVLDQGFCPSWDSDALELRMAWANEIERFV